VDLGTGDGRAVLARARREPGALVVGIDASAAGMAESSLRAARSEKRGGLPNVLFLAGAAECPPIELYGIADEITILFPWGSLLRGTLALDDAVAAGIASLIRPGGRAEAFVSVTDRDGLGLDPLRPTDGAALARRWAAHGLDLATFRPATAIEIAATHSTWARRLRTGRDRPAWRLVLRCGGRSPQGG
jgi:16S rRNA (adenine(1408)-N(1))-methyltransferase